MTLFVQSHLKRFFFLLTINDSLNVYCMETIRCVQCRQQNHISAYFDYSIWTFEISQLTLIVIFEFNSINIGEGSLDTVSEWTIVLRRPLKQSINSTVVLQQKTWMLAPEWTNQMIEIKCLFKCVHNYMNT